MLSAKWRPFYHDGLCVLKRDNKNAALPLVKAYDFKSHYQCPVGIGAI